MNVPEDNPDPENLPFGSAADRFLSETRAAGGEPILTVPLIGWTPKTRAKSWGFSVQSYGAQTETECTATGWAFWCQPDAGNGIRPGGAFVTGNNPLDTSIADRPVVRHGLDGPPRRAVRDGGKRRHPLLRPRQRARALGLDAPRRPPAAAHVRRALDEVARRRRRDQGEGPGRGRLRAGVVGLVRVLLLRGRRLLAERRGLHRPRERAADAVVPAAGAPVPGGARRAARRRPRRPLLPAGDGRGALGRRVGRDVGPAAPVAPEPLGPDVRRRVVDPRRRCGSSRG